jgi:SAM-dependent methyltransferase
MYDAFWADWYFPAAVPALERLFFDVVPLGETVLDVCCGSGHVAGEVAKRGYRVVGVDQSAALIASARARLPDLKFYVQDVRRLVLRERFRAAYSTFDALNHLLTLEDLREAFQAIHGVLLPGALFVFDMNLEEAYFADSRAWTAMVADKNVGLVRGLYDRQTKVASTELIWFAKTRRRNLWEERRSVVQERCYEQAEIVDALLLAGFKDPQASWACDLGVTADLGYGRMFFTVRA